MNPLPDMQLDNQQVNDLSSVYINEGVKKDCWEILELEISDTILKARLRMTSFFVSPTDPVGFHLTIFSTQEFLAQLANIYLHVAEGYTVKSKETWMRECNITSRSTIRDPENIMVEMDFFGRKKLGDTLICMARCRVYDDQEGLFTAKLKGMLR